MKGTICVLLLLASFRKGDASKIAIPPAVANGSGGRGAANVVLDPRKDSAMATLELLHKEHDQLRQDMQQSQNQVMAMVLQLQEENSRLKQQQQDRQAMVLAMIADVSKEIRDHQQAVSQHVQTQVSALVRSVEEVKGQQQMVLEQAGMVLSVLQDFEHCADVTSQLILLHHRMAVVGDYVLKLQTDGSDCSTQLTTVQQRVDRLESLLQNARGSEAHSTPPPTTLSTILPALTNVALNKPAQLSTYDPLYNNPANAVDGNKATNIRMCFHTSQVDTNPNRWWRVDLMGMFEVEAVVITNRGDCCGHRLTNFDIYVMEDIQLDPSESTHNPSDLCLHRQTPIPDGATVRLQCDRPIIGQYVSVVLWTDSWPLHFCEIEVLGRPATATVIQSIVTTTSQDSTPTFASLLTTPTPWEESGSEEGSGNAGDNEAEASTSAVLGERDSDTGSGEAESDGNENDSDEIFFNIYRAL